MTMRAAGVTDVGAQRVVNEDRYHLDAERGIFIVVDGVGGQAAGGRAADTALGVLRAKLTNTNGAPATRLREAITSANNEVLREASSRPEWAGMACVLTAVVIDGERAFVGHVGDTRFYKIRAGAIQKITPDHSPVGEREDAGEISELDAMQHPRRNEVYRDVGSDPHTAGDADFVDVRETTWEPEAALLLCSDGLTDLVSSSTILRIVGEHAGKPDEVTRALVKAANAAGGKDNITVIYIEGDRFKPRVAGARRFVVPLTIGLMLIAGAGMLWRSAGYPLPEVITNALTHAQANTIAVRPDESIAAAIDRAQAGTTVLVEPGEYRERLTLKTGVRVVSLVSRGATIRLPVSATDDEAAIRAIDVNDAELSGFRLVGDAASALGTGILARGSGVRLIDLEVTGAARTAVDLGPGRGVMLLGSDIHDNPGVGLALRANASPRIAHNTFGANGSSEQAAGAMVFETGLNVYFQGNVFRQADPKSFAFLDASGLAQLKAANWFPDARPATAGRGRGR